MKKNGTFSSNIVCAAYMLTQESQKSFHYTDLAEKIIASNLCTLGANSSTPADTLYKEMIVNKKLFKRTGASGEFTLAEGADKNKEVKLCVLFHSDLFQG